jgi:uncharacterized protein
MTMERVPFRKGLFTVENDMAFLIGNKCPACGQIYFPSKPFCFECFGESLDPIRLGARGRLYSYTVAYMPSAHSIPPYTGGWIDLDEGIRIFAPIEVDEGRTLDIGMDMELTIDELWREGETSITGYRYRPK